MTTPTCNSARSALAITASTLILALLPLAKAQLTSAVLSGAINPASSTPMWFGQPTPGGRPFSLSFTFAATTPATSDDGVLADYFDAAGSATLTFGSEVGSATAFTGVDVVVANNYFDSNLGGTFDELLFTSSSEDGSIILSGALYFNSGVLGNTLLSSLNGIDLNSWALTLPGVGNQSYLAAYTLPNDLTATASGVVAHAVIAPVPEASTLVSAVLFSLAATGAILRRRRTSAQA